jgi:hypothetical protein
MNPALMGDQRKQEYAVLTNPDGTKQMLWGSRAGDGKTEPHRVDIPAGHFAEVSHNHPNGSTLSYADLQLLKGSTDKIEAKGHKVFSATRGPHFDQLDKAESDIMSDMSNPYAPQQPKSGELPQDNINRELNKRGIIQYSENPLENALAQRTPTIKQ